MAPGEQRENERKSLRLQRSILGCVQQYGLWPQYEVRTDSSRSR